MTPAKPASFQFLPRREKLVLKDWVPLGRVLCPHGVKGALKLGLENPHSQSLQPGISLGFQISDHHLALAEITEIKGGGRIYFKEIPSRNEAEHMNLLPVFIRRDEMPALLDNEVYLIDLIGAQVIHSNGLPLGEISGFSDNRAQILAEVKTLKDEKVLVPFVEPILKSISKDNRTVILDPPLGLFEEEF